jgi:hypothetical protein
VPASSVDEEAVYKMTLGSCVARLDLTTKAAEDCYYWNEGMG